MDMRALLLISQKCAEDMNLYFILDQFSLSCMAVKTKSNVLNSSFYYYIFRQVFQSMPLITRDLPL